MVNKIFHYISSSCQIFEKGKKTLRTVFEFCVLLLEKWSESAVGMDHIHAKQLFYPCISSSLFKVAFKNPIFI